MELLSKLKNGVGLLLGTSLFVFFVFIFSVINAGIASSMNLLSWLYYVLAAFGHAALLSTILYLLFYFPFCLLFKNKNIATWVYSVVATLFMIVLILDSLVFDIYKFHLNGFVWELLTGGGADQIFVFDWILYLKFFGVVFFLAVLPYLMLVFVSNKYKFMQKRGRVLLLSIASISCIFISHVGYAIAHATREPHIQKAATALPWFFPLTANSLFTKLGIIQPDELDSLSYNQLSVDLQYPLNPIQKTDSVPHYNIIYLIVDSWNPTVFDADVTPNAYRFAKEKGQVFSNHLSSNYATRGGIFGIFFGLSFTYEREFNISKMSPLLVDRLIDLNYDIQTFPSASITNPPFNEILFRRVPNIRTQAEGNDPFERDNSLTKTFVDYLDKRDTSKPFFSFLFYDMLHNMVIPKDYLTRYTPSWAAPDYMSLSNDMDRTPFFNLYKNCAYYEDQLIGDILKKVDEKGLLDNTIIVITGDHGQEFNENKKNYWGHSGNYSKWQIQAPFIIYYPGIEPGKTIDHVTTHYDISPTILTRFLGVKNSTNDFSMGYDLWDAHNRFPHIVGDHVNYAFVMHNAILKTGHTGSLDVTDLNLNPISRDSINIKELKQAIDLKNKFYK